MSKDWTQENAIDVMEAEITALRAEVERLKAEVSALNHAEVKLLVQVDEQDAEIERLRAALREAIEFASQDEQCLTPAGKAMVARWRTALEEDGDD